MPDLAVHNSVKIKQCEFRGCQGCEFSMDPSEESYACILGNGVNYLYNTVFLGKIAGVDAMAIPNILNAIPDYLPGQEEDYKYFDRATLEQLLSELEPVLEAAKELYVLQDTQNGWEYPFILKEEVVERVKELDLEFLLSTEKDDNGDWKPALTNLSFQMFGVYDFIKKALDKDFLLDGYRHDIRLVIDDEKILTKYSGL